MSASLSVPSPVQIFKAHGLSKWTDQLLETPQTTPTDRITVARPKRLGTRATFVLQIGGGCHPRKKHDSENMESLTAAPRASRHQCKMLSLHDSAAKGFQQLSESSLISTVSTFTLVTSRKYKHGPHSPCTAQVMFHRAINNEDAATSPRSLLRHRTPIHNDRTRSARCSVERR